MFKDYIYPDYFPEYIGLKITNGKYKFVFPYMYPKANDDKELKLDMLNILKFITKYKSFQKINDKFNKEYHFPFDIYLWIIKDYLNNGYYYINEKEFNVSEKGKIDWKKTIKNNDIIVCDENIIYRNYVVKNNNRNQNIITLIHKFCVYEAISKMGWFYDLNIHSIEKVDLSFKKTIMINLLNNEFTKTFVDKNKMLLKNMVKMLEGLDENKYNTKSFDLSTKEFEYVFERVIEERLANVDVSEYYPKAIWNINNKKYNSSDLRPDAIFIKDNKAYILDAKFYKYGYTNFINDLPGSSSIQKQITYSEDLIKNNKDINEVYNIFILPCNSNKVFDYIGYAETTWKDNDKTYEKIYAIKADLKSLINNDLKEKMKYQELLIECLNCNI